VSTLAHIPAEELQEVGCPYPEPQLGFLVHEPRKVNNLTLIDGKTFLSTTVSGTSCHRELRMLASFMMTLVF